MTSERNALRGKENLLNLLEDCLGGAPGDGVELVAQTSRVAVTRYANNRIHQNVWQDNPRVWVRVLVGGAMASLTCNTLERERIKQTIAEAAAIARRLPDKTHPGFASNSQESKHVPEPGTEGLLIPGGPAPENPVCFFENTANQRPDERAEAIGRVVELAKAAGFVAYGTYKTTLTELAVANTNGLGAYAPATSAYLKVLVEREDGSGYADQHSRDANLIDPVATANTAITKCRLNVNQIELPPGDYAAVLEPNTVADMVRFLVIHGGGAQQLQDGRSFMTGQMGQPVTGTNINLWEDPHHPGAMPFPLDYEGLQSRAVPLVIGGKAAGVVYDRRTASRIPGQSSTGHAALEGDPLPDHVVMLGGSKTTEELVKGMQRGLIVTRLHYTHCPDPRKVVATGTTRDGTFLVENGEIVAAVRNMRFTQSVLDLLSGVEEFGQPKTCQDWWASNDMGVTYYYLPALRVSRCTFTGVTTF